MPPRFRVLIDNDFSGDPDDLFQLAHHVLSPSVEVRGIIGSHLAPGDFLDASTTTATNAVREAHQLLEVAGLAGRYPVVEGANHALVNDQPLRSAACELIVNEALRASDQRLFVACGAGLTDLASALMVRPDIASRLTLVWIGGPEYPDLAAPPPGSRGVEYNLNIDLRAARYVFDQPGLEIWQVPRNAYRQCLVSLAELESRVKPHGPLGDSLFHSLDRAFGAIGRTPGPDAETYVLGDQPLVLLTALQSLFEADPSSSASVWRDRPRIGWSGQYEPGEAGAKVRVFTHLDTRLMFEDFYAKLARWAAQAR